MFSAIIYGETASKANSRQLVKINGQPRLIKSAKARAWMDSAVLQLRAKRPPVPYDEPVIMDCRIYYGSNRPDLSEELVMDALQKAEWIKNDRLIIEKHVWKYVDKASPRVEVTVSRRFG